MRDSPRNEGRRWLDQAQVDLQWARHLLAEGAYYLVCFLAQQLAEKALKALLYAQGEELVIGHSVRQSCQRATAYDMQLLAYLEDWAILDSYYIPTPYPNGLPADIPARVYNREAARSALTLAEAVYTHIDTWFTATGLDNQRESSS